MRTLFSLTLAAFGLNLLVACDISTSPGASKPFHSLSHSKGRDD